MNSLKIFTKGIIKENPVFVMLLGLCPALAVSSMAVNGLGMGLATTFVLVFSNLIISLLRNIIPDSVRIPCYIVIIAGLVTLVSIILRTFMPDLYNALGIFLSLIAVNCIIFGRAESFANKNKSFPSILDALGMGLGFTMALLMVGSIREILGAGSWFGMKLGVEKLGMEPMILFILPAGGFFTLAVLVALINRLMKQEPRVADCEGCPGRSACKGITSPKIASNATVVVDGNDNDLKAKPPEKEGDK